jgi:hypothetical protein
VVATLPALSAAETRAAEVLLARAWGPGTSVRAAEPIWDRSHVVRLHLATGRSVVMKKRAGKDTFGAELGALEYLNGMPEPVAPRLLGADADAGILLMEDLGPGPSLADSLLIGDRSRVRADLVSYAEALGSMHAWSMGRPRDPRLGTPPWPDAVARGKDAFLDAAVSLGLSAVAAGTEIDQLSLLLNETGYHGLVHGDPCPDNVRFLDGRCRIFDFEHSGWGAVALDASYLLAPFPSCWCFGRLPASTFVGCSHDRCPRRLDRCLGGRDRQGAGGRRRVGHYHDAAPAAGLAAQLHFRGGPFGRASGPSCPGRRTARAAIGALAGGGHRGLPGPRPARFGAGSGA